MVGSSNGLAGGATPRGRVARNTVSSEIVSVSSESAVVSGSRGRATRGSNILRYFGFGKFIAHQDASPSCRRSTHVERRCGAHAALRSFVPTRLVRVGSRRACSVLTVGSHRNSSDVRIALVSGGLQGCSTRLDRFVGRAPEASRFRIVRGGFALRSSREVLRNYPVTTSFATEWSPPPSVRAHTDLGGATRWLRVRTRHFHNPCTGDRSRLAARPVNSELAPDSCSNAKGAGCSRPRSEQVEVSLNRPRPNARVDQGSRCSERAVGKTAHRHRSMRLSRRSSVHGRHGLRKECRERPFDKFSGLRTVCAGRAWVRECCEGRETLVGRMHLANAEGATAAVMRYGCQRGEIFEGCEQRCWERLVSGPHFGVGRVGPKRSESCPVPGRNKPGISGRLNPSRW